MVVEPGEPGESHPEDEPGPARQETVGKDCSSAEAGDPDGGADRPVAPVGPAGETRPRQAHIGDGGQGHGHRHGGHPVPQGPRAGDRGAGEDRRPDRERDPAVLADPKTRGATRTFDLGEQQPGVLGTQGGRVHGGASIRQSLCPVKYFAAQVGPRRRVPLRGPGGRLRCMALPPDLARTLADEFVHQLPDLDPEETREWQESLDAVAAERGAGRARFLVAKLLERAHELDLGVPSPITTPYINTIPVEDEPEYPGDGDLERRIRRLVRWNAAVMVVKANHVEKGIGGHLSTFASSATLYEVGYNHFFRGRTENHPGDHVYFQGHAAPGMYARAFLERRLDEKDLDRFRFEVGGGLSSYPHPRLMPDFWEFPTVSMGLGPICSIYHARFLRYLEHRGIDNVTDSKVWCFVGDGEVDEPETLGAISLAARENLDNLIWVVNCNLQRLDGPVRGNSKIIQELEAVFRGAGWNVIKVIWGSGWDALLAKDVDGALLNVMNETVDGEYQRYKAEDGAYVRKHFFGKDPRAAALVED